MYRCVVHKQLHVQIYTIVYFVPDFGDWPDNEILEDLAVLRGERRGPREGARFHAVLGEPRGRTLRGSSSRGDDFKATRVNTMHHP